MQTCIQKIYKPKGVNEMVSTKFYHCNRSLWHTFLHFNILWQKWTIPERNSLYSGMVRCLFSILLYRNILNSYRFLPCCVFSLNFQIQGYGKLRWWNTIFSPILISFQKFVYKLYTYIYYIINLHNTQIICSCLLFPILFLYIFFVLQKMVKM